MKKELSVMYKFVVGFALVSLIFWSCKEELNKTGYGLLDKGDLVSVKKTEIDKTTIKSFTVTDLKQRTDETTYNLLGTFNDPVFGKTTADFAVQFRLSRYPDLSKNAQPDSLVLYLLYREFFGDAVTPQRLKVYELASDLSFDAQYDQDVNLKAISKGEVLADFNYVPKFKLDSLTNLYGSTKAKPKDTVIQEIAIKLNASLINKLWAADSLTLSKNDLFLEYFKGLYIEAADLNQGGAIIRIYTLAGGSRMIMHYHNSEEDSLFYNYNINENSARVGRFSHDYTNTAFAANLDKKTNQDSLIYLQTTGGLGSKILIPNLNLWRDSANIAINKAELIFTVDQFYTDTANYTPPYQVILSAINEKDDLYFPSDLAFSQAYFGGVYNKTDGTFRFNIAKHMQELMTKKPNGVGYLRENFGFFLSMADRNSNYGRVVLKGATSTTGIRLEITYSKIN
ncbi:MAG: DUF4270 family protein [Bacteroidota bacterium]|nr:DUF4270 family protein [Bacteroidota bacterium]